MLLRKLKQVQYSEPGKPGSQHIISMENMRFSSHPRAKVGQQGPPGSARGLSWWEFNIWNGPVWSFSLWISLGNTHAFIAFNILHLSESKIIQGVKGCR